MPRPYRPLALRYGERAVPSLGCWSWDGPVDKRGYGRLYLQGRNGPALAHRISYELHVGPIPAGLEVCHRCDNPPCTNPAHLFLGTHADNMRDAGSKGRMKHPGIPGSANARAKLTEAMVIEARRRHADGEPMAWIARDFPVSTTTMVKAIKGEKWAHVPMTRYRGGA